MVTLRAGFNPDPFTDLIRKSFCLLLGGGLLDMSYQVLVKLDQIHVEKYVAFVINHVNCEKVQKPFLGRFQAILTLNIGVMRANEIRPV